VGFFLSTVQESVGLNAILIGHKKSQKLSLLAQLIYTCPDN
jgi:hypothetical protein